MQTGRLDDILLKAKDVCDIAAKKGGELYAVSKYRYERIRLHGEVKKLYEQLGGAVYAMVKEKYSNDELIASLTEEIDNHLARIKELDALLCEAKNAAACPVCGSQNSPDNRYCARCGAKMYPGG